MTHRRSDARAAMGVLRLGALAFLVALPAAARAAEPSGAFVQSLAYTTGVATLTLDIEAGRDDAAAESDSDSERKVYRGAIPFGSGSHNAMRFMVDLDKNLLFLDRNRNGNLKDDGPGVAANTNDDRIIRFENLVVEAKAGKAVVPYVIDLNCYSRHRFWRVEVKSGWQGTVELAGRKWNLCAMDDLDGALGENDLLILRSDVPASAAVNAAESGCRGSSDRPDRLPVATNLTLNGRTFGIGFGWRGSGSASVLDVTFVPVSPACGTIEIDSSLVKRIVMEGPGVVLLDPAPASVKVPQGFYDSVTVYMGEAGKPATHMSRLKPMRILADGARHIKAGGAIRNVVNVSERGAFLRLDYDLQDSYSNSCQALVWRSDNKPTFSIRKDGKEIASGSFEYG